VSESRDQRSFFREVERDYWAGAEGLKPEERALIETRLVRDGATLEAGTGGGRIVRAMRALGFTKLAGFDFAPELIDAARSADADGAIDFRVADATALPYGDAEFDQLIYFQQIVCTIESAQGRRAALAEAARVLRPGGTALFSFLCLEGREHSPVQRAFVAYLRALRAVRRPGRELQLMPRLRLRGKVNPAALRDAGPYTYWYRAAEAAAELEAAGLRVEGLACAPDAARGVLHPDPRALVERGELDQTLYVVCGKG
jgi:ubiquinone/menaquinone biosynthesis C-methylase UbiE